MRTTVELPDALMRRAKAAAALRGQSLRAFFSEAVRRELGRGNDGGAQTGRRVALPLFGGGRAVKRRLVNADLEQVLADSESLTGRTE